MEIWIGLIGALGGILVGALAEFIRVRAQFRRDKGWALFEERRKRIEEVYTVVEQNRTEWAQAYINAIQIIADRTSKTSKSFNPPQSRLKLLVDLYLPELKSEHTRLQAAEDVFMKRFSKAVSPTPRTDEELKSLIGELTLTQEILREHHVEFVKSVSKLSVLVSDNAMDKYRVGISVKRV